MKIKKDTKLQFDDGGYSKYDPNLVRFNSNCCVEIDLNDMDDGLRKVISRYVLEYCGSVKLCLGKNGGICVTDNDTAIVSEEFDFVAMVSDEIEVLSDCHEECLHERLKKLKEKLKEGIEIIDKYLSLKQ